MFGIFVLMLVVAFSVVAIAGNFMAHEGASRRSARPVDAPPDEFVPRVLALSAVRANDQKAA